MEYAINVINEYLNSREAFKKFSKKDIYFLATELVFSELDDKSNEFEQDIDEMILILESIKQEEFEEITIGVNYYDELFNNFIELYRVVKETRHYIADDNQYNPQFLDLTKSIIGLFGSVIKKESIEGFSIPLFDTSYKIASELVNLKDEPEEIFDILYNNSEYIKEVLSLKDTLEEQILFLEFYVGILSCKYSRKLKKQ